MYCSHPNSSEHTLSHSQSQCPRQPRYMEMVLSCTVLRIDLSFVSKNLWFSPLSWSNTLRSEESQRLKINWVDPALEEEEVNPGKKVICGTQNWETSRPLPGGRVLSNLSPRRPPAEETRKFHCPLTVFILSVIYKSTPLPEETT